MLQSIRDRATGWIAWAIVILISIPFALWGIQQYLSPSSSIAVATVNGQEVSYERFQQAYGRQQAQLRAMLGAAYSPELIDETLLRRRTLENLVRDELLVQTADDEGMRIGDAQLAGAIQSQESFQSTGRFSQELYNQWLRGRGYSPGGFEFDLRRSMLTEQMSSGLVASEFTTAHEVEDLVRLRGQKRTVATLVVRAAEQEPAEVDEAAAREYFDARRDDFVAPQRLDLEAIVLSREEVAAGIEVGDELLRSVYEARKATLATPESRVASHILIIVDAGADEAAVGDARERIEALRARIEAGESFDDIARAHSEDPGSAAQGGSLGAFSRGVMDPAFEEVAFSLEPGVLSEPVRSAFGFHLIRVASVESGAVKPFEEVREQLARDYRAEQSEQLFFERMERLANLAFEHPGSLEPAAEALGLRPVHTGLGGRTDEGVHSLLASDSVWQAALVPEVLEQGVNSELVELDSSRVAVVRVLEHVAESRQAFEAVREQVVAAVRAERAAEGAREAGERMLEALRGGEDRVMAAQGLGAEWSAPATVDRFASEPGREILEAVFRLARPADGAVVYEGVELAGGDFAIIALEGVEDAAGGESADENTRNAASTTLSADLGQRSFEAVVESLREGADVVLNEGGLDSL
jgi:peptidyl-prolyl cis-trans isomerase D